MEFTKGDTSLTAASRLGRAVCDLAIHPHGRMSYRVASTFGAERPIDVAKSVARALGYTTVDAPMPNNPDVDVAQLACNLSDLVSRVPGPVFILLYATQYDGGEAHRAIVENTARIAHDAWSENGRTTLMVLGLANPEPLARLIGETLRDHDWAASIPS